MADFIPHHNKMERIKLNRKFATDILLEDEILIKLSIDNLKFLREMLEEYSKRIVEDVGIEAEKEDFDLGFMLLSQEKVKKAAQLEKSLNTELLLYVKDIK